MITKSDIMPIRGTAIIRPAFPYTGKVKYINLGMGKRVGRKINIKKK